VNQILEDMLRACAISLMARWWSCQKTCWRVVNDRPVGKSQEKVLMNIAASFPTVKKPRNADLGEERQTTEGDAC
jgi:hypothetical protein